MKYVLDTNTVSFLMRGHLPVVSRLTRERRTDVYLPQPVLAELEYGLARMPRSARRLRLRRRLDILLVDLVRADWSDEVSKAFGRVKAELEKKGHRLEDFDVAVAAHTLALEGVLVTDNTRHMSRVARLRLENWNASS